MIYLKQEKENSIYFLKISNSYQRQTKKDIAFTFMTTLQFIELLALNFLMIPQQIWDNEHLKKISKQPIYLLFEENENSVSFLEISNKVINYKLKILLLSHFL